MGMDGSEVIRRGVSVLMQSQHGTLYSYRVSQEQKCQNM